VNSLALERVTAMRDMRKRMIEKRAGACGLALALLVATAGMAAAQESSGDWYDTRIMRRILEEIGLRKNEKPIDYHERAPLVIPPNHALPPPQRDAALSRNPNWPKDPDVERAQKQELTSYKPPWDEDLNRPLRPSELNKGTVPRRSQRTASSGSQDLDGPARLSPSELGVKRNIFNIGSWFGHHKDETVPFKGEPPRTSLIQPPKGYRTPSSAEPYGLTKHQARTKATDSFTTRSEVKPQ
jgi:hypothetical protein